MSAPVPSGRVQNVQNISVLQNVVLTSGRDYDEYYLKNSNHPSLRNDPRLHEVLARHHNMKLNKDLEQARSKIEESKTTINSLQQTHSEQLNALTDYKNKENQLEEEVRRLRSDNLALNKTLIDMTINKTGDITITENTSEFNQLQQAHIERSQIRMLRDAIMATQKQAENTDERMKKMQECYDLKEQQSQQKLATLQAQLNDAMIEIDDKDETIKANMDLNQTITIDKAQLQLFKDRYEETLQEYKQAQLESKSRSENHLRTTVKFQQEYKVIQDKEKKTAKALAALTNQLQKEKLENAVVTNKFKHSRRMYQEEHEKKSAWKKISERQEAEISDLTRELAASRQENKNFEKRLDNIGCFGRLFKI